MTEGNAIPPGTGTAPAVATAGAGSGTQNNFTFRIPLPCSPSSSCALFKARFKNLFAITDPRVLAAFWLFGLLNNVLYVIILSAALDLVGPSLPKSLVLLFDVLPSFITKLCLPYIIHAVPYTLRIPILVALSFIGMQFVAHAPNLSSRMFGVVLASVSSGAGELSFLGLTHFYGPFALAAWGSGTGAAGLVGAGLYTVATTWLRWGVRESLFGFGFLPFVMLGAFFWVLPREMLRYSSLEGEEEVLEIEREDEDEDHGGGGGGGGGGNGDGGGDGEGCRGDGNVGNTSLLEGLSRGHAIHHQHHHHTTFQKFLHSFKTNFKRSRNLFYPYMLPLLLVYIGEYTINQGISPTLLFPLPETPFEHYRDFYPTYNTIYQTGVFVSRSSYPFIRIRRLYPPSLLQLVNLIFLLLHALYPYIPNVYLVFVVIFWEGLLGGAVYVNTFGEIIDNVRMRDREFSLGATSVSDSAGICVAGFLGLWLEPWICEWQVSRGRGFCRMS